MPGRPGAAPTKVEHSLGSTLPAPARRRPCSGRPAAPVLRLVICLAWLVLSCGQVLFWWRRDNIVGYLQAGFFFASIAVPVLGTSIIDDLDPVDVNRYADIMVIGAVAYLAGLAYGASLGDRVGLGRLTVGRPPDIVPRQLVVRARRVGLAGVAVLGLSFALLGYVPLLAAHRLLAKYGIGPYAAGYARGGLVLHVGLIVASTVLPVALALFVRHRRPIDAALAGALLLGLTVTLSRGRAFIGPLVFLIALAVERRWRAGHILAAVCFSFVAGTLFNELVALSSSPEGSTFASRVAASAPDVSDHVLFLHGYQAQGAEQVGLKPILASLSVDKGEYNAATYALRIRTGLDDVTGLASGGLRLPAPIWGYASFGFPGLVVWSLLSGVAIGWGTRLLRREVAGVEGRRGQCLNLVLAWVLFEGTFAVVGEFYFLERVGVVSFLLAAYLCWSRGRPWARVDPAPAPAVIGSPAPGSSWPGWRGPSAPPTPRRRGTTPARAGRRRSSRPLRAGGSPRRTTRTGRSW